MVALGGGRFLISEVPLYYSRVLGRVVPLISAEAFPTIDVDTIGTTE